MLPPTESQVPMLSVSLSLSLFKGPTASLSGQRAPVCHLSLRLDPEEGTDVFLLVEHASRLPVPSLVRLLVFFLPPPHSTPRVVLVSYHIFILSFVEAFIILAVVLALLLNTISSVTKMNSRCFNEFSSYSQSNFR